MRGTPAMATLATVADGIIPAYAGNTCRGTMRKPDARDHPRVCGEHPNTGNAMFAALGSSPRMRGTPVPSFFHALLSGIIPAYAGNTCHCARRRCRCRDHPRVCGEHGTLALVDDVAVGSSPRMRGTRLVPSHRNCCRGIIPAYAGNTGAFEAVIALLRDHPRVCGEHSTTSRSAATGTGSSPRMRGTLTLVSGCVIGAGIIPAYAGNTLKNPSSESRNPIIELHFNQFAKKVKRCFAIRFRPMRCFIFKVQ